MPKPVNSKSEKTRAYIIEKVAPVFNKKGFAGTSLTDLEEVTGLSKGSIYGNFRDKNEVALEAFKYNFACLTKEVSEGLEHHYNAKEKLLSMVNFYKKNYVKIFENGGCAILNTATDSDDSNELLKMEVVKALESWGNVIKAIVQEGIVQGDFGKVDPEKFAYKIIALVEGSIFLAKTTGNYNCLIYNLDSLSDEIKNLKN